MEDGASSSVILRACGLYAAAAGGLIVITLCRNMVRPSMVTNMAVVETPQLAATSSSSGIGRTPDS